MFEKSVEIRQLQVTVEETLLMHVGNMGNYFIIK